MTQAGTKDHPITIEPIHERVRVIWHGRTIGDSKSALELGRRTIRRSSMFRAPTWT